MKYSQIFSKIFFPPWKLFSKKKIPKIFGIYFNFFKNFFANPALFQVIAPSLPLPASKDRSWRSLIFCAVTEASRCKNFVDLILFLSSPTLESFVHLCMQSCGNTAGILMMSLWSCISICKKLQITSLTYLLEFVAASMWLKCRQRRINRSEEVGKEVRSEKN